MKYENAADILPKEVLSLVQKYAPGKLLYIPAGDKKLRWGESSGCKTYLRDRNNEIRDCFASDESIESLSALYSLSYDTIKKIVYSRKEKFMAYKCTLSSATEFADAGKLEDWIHIYLLSDGHNKAFFDGLKIYERYFIGPLILPLALFTRCTGPEEGLPYHIPAEAFEKHVQKLQKVLQENNDMPPLIANYVDGHLELNDGNHRFEALKRLGAADCHFIVWITEKRDYDDFCKKFSFTQHRLPS